MHLPNMAPNIRIASLNRRDVIDKTDNYRNLYNLVASQESMYPRIDAWLNDKVLPGLIDGSRSVYVGYLDDKPLLSAVLKKNVDSKVCHLRLDESLQDLNVGEMIFSLMILEARQVSRNIHFTLPSSLWEKRGSFFRSFGFADATVAGTQYRMFDMELKCSNSYTHIWESMVHRLPKIMSNFCVDGKSVANSLVLSLKPKYAHAIIDGSKRIELRRKFSEKWVGSTVNLYASSPEQRIVGRAKIASVEKAPPQDIWERHNSTLGCTKDEFEAYVDGLSEAYAVFIEEVSPLPTSLRLRDLRKLTPPQSYCLADTNEGWSEAVSIASLLAAKTSTPIKI